jgi:hypothetical protein
MHEQETWEGQGGRDLGRAVSQQFTFTFWAYIKGIKAKEKHPGLQKEHLALQSMKFLHFFFGGGGGLISGSTNPLNPEPDPKHWLEGCEKVELTNQQITKIKQHNAQ